MAAPSTEENIAASLPPKTRIGDYIISRKIAQGGFGVVYLGKDSVGNWVAIKEYFPAKLVTRPEGTLKPIVKPEKLSMYKSGLKSFFEEGRALAQMNHPSIVYVHDFFRQNDTVYMVMNYLVGNTLSQYIQTAIDLNSDYILHDYTVRLLFSNIANGLRIAHQARLLHLDLKPENIFIQDNNTPVIIDFGASRIIGKPDPSGLRTMFTPGYAPPEMYDKKPMLGPWTDIYSLGACMYASILGFTPDEAPKRMKSSDTIEILKDAQQAYSANLIDLVGWCLELNPKDRPPSVLAVTNELSKLPDPEDIGRKKQGFIKRKLLDLFE